MRKILCISIVLAIITLSACNSKNESPNTPTDKSTITNDGYNYDDDSDKKVKYSSLEVDWQSWGDAKSLVESELTDFVVTGTVKKISFLIIDPTTGLPPEAGAKERYDEQYGREVEPWKVFDLVTVYDIDVEYTVMGETSSFLQIMFRGGLKDVFIDEQMAAIKEYNIEYIPIVEGGVELKIGDSYLFVLNQYGEALPTPINLQQSVYNLSNPFDKITLHNNVLGNPEDYYSLSEDNNGNPIISAKDVISAFGEDKWNEFWTEWQADNPDWEARIDKSAVEKALSEH